MPSSPHAKELMKRGKIYREPVPNSSPAFPRAMGNRGNPFQSSLQRLRLGKNRPAAVPNLNAQRGRNLAPVTSTPIFSNTPHTPPNNVQFLACDLCSSREHKPVHCTKPMGAQALMDFVVKNRLCLNCLRKGHQTQKCRQQSYCGKDGCNLKHHRRLHGLPRLQRRNPNQN